MQRVGIVFQHGHMGRLLYTFVVIVHSLCSQVGGGYIDMPLLSFSIGLVGDGALALALPFCRLAVVRRLCQWNSAYLSFTPRHVLFLWFHFGQWKGKRSSKISICWVQSFCLPKGLAPI